MYLNVLIYPPWSTQIINPKSFLLSQVFKAFGHRKRFGNGSDHPHPETNCEFIVMLQKAFGDTMLITAILNNTSVLTKVCSEGLDDSPDIE